MKGYIQPGEVITIGFTTSASAPAGQGMLVGKIFGVAVNDIPATTVEANAVLQRLGVVQIKKAGSLSVAIGDTLYWDDSGKVVNKTDTTKEVGYALTSTSNGAGETTIQMQLVPTLRNATNS